MRLQDIELILMRIEKPHSFATWVGRTFVAVLLLQCVVSVGCLGYARGSIRPDEMPPELHACEKGSRVPINYAMLGQIPPRDHVLGSGDVVGVYIKGILPPGTDDLPIVNSSLSLNQIYYPPAGNVETPTVGAPLEIAEGGTLPIPFIGPVKVGGLTVQQATDLIIKKLIEKDVVKESREYVYLKLVRKRTKRVVVVREDSAVQSPAFIELNSYPYAKKGEAVVVDLPVYEDDVLHALASSGGLPGIDVMNEVWVLRKENLPPEYEMELLQPTFDSDPISYIESPPVRSIAKRLRLWSRPGETTPFSAQDILLEEGDVVYLRPRQKDVFYTGGLLPGGMVQLPRDYDVDILEAIALAGGGVGGPSGGNGRNFVQISGSRAVIPPSRVLVVRKLDNGDQVTIRLDLRKAFNDSSQRIIIVPGDFVVLSFRHSELISNIALGLVNFNVSYSMSNRSGGGTPIILP